MTIVFAILLILLLIVIGLYIYVEYKGYKLLTDEERDSKRERKDSKYEMKIYKNERSPWVDR